MTRRSLLTPFISEYSMRIVIFTFTILRGEKWCPLSILICYLQLLDLTCFIVHLPRACSLPISLCIVCLFFIDLLKLFISPAFKCHPPHTPPTLLWELPVDRAQGVGPSPPGNLGFLWNVLMRRQAASPRFLLWAFWGHSLAQPPHQEGSFFRQSPQERERVR